MWVIETIIYLLSTVYTFFSNLSPAYTFCVVVFLTQYCLIYIFHVSRVNIT